MENWGLITYGMDNLKQDVSTSPTYSLFRTADIQCHEISHMWFGDLGNVAIQS